MKLPKVPKCIPPAMRLALENMNPIMRGRMIDSYLKGNRAKRLEMEFLFDGGAAEVVRQIQLEVEDGTPTSADLDEQFR